MPLPSRSPREPLPSRLSGPPAPCACSAIMQSFRYQSSELQPAFARGVGERRDAATVGVAAAVEHDLLDACGLGTLGDELSDPHAVGLLVSVDDAAATVVPLRSFTSCT